MNKSRAVPASRVLTVRPALLLGAAFILATTLSPSKVLALNGGECSSPDRARSADQAIAVMRSYDPILRVRFAGIRRLNVKYGFEATPNVYITKLHVIDAVGFYKGIINLFSNEMDAFDPVKRYYEAYFGDDTIIGFRDYFAINNNKIDRVYRLYGANATFELCRITVDESRARKFGLSLDQFWSALKAAAHGR